MSPLGVESLRIQNGSPLSFTVGAGEILCLSGPSGCGKSLLLRAIADLDPRSGRVRLGETCCDHTEPTLWRRQVGLLPAVSHWWRERVADHFPPAFPAADWLPHLSLPPEAFAWNVERISSGERQRLAILRLLAVQPRALLLDEPTANLDGVTTGQVEALIKNYCLEQRAPVLWVSHDPEQIRRLADRHLRFADGALVEDGAPVRVSREGENG